MSTSFSELNDRPDIQMNQSLLLFGIQETFKRNTEILPTLQETRKQMKQTSASFSPVCPTNKPSAPIFRELTGKYCVTGFLTVRRSFSRLPTADMLNF